MDHWRIGVSNSPMIHLSINPKMFGQTAGMEDSRLKQDDLFHIQREDIQPAIEFTWFL